MSEKELKQNFGASKDLIKSAVDALEGRTHSPSDINVSNATEKASQLADSGYEYGTGWGKQVC